MITFNRLEIVRSKIRFFYLQFFDELIKFHLFQIFSIMIFEMILLHFIVDLFFMNSALKTKYRTL